MLVAVISILIPKCEEGEKCFVEIVPLVLWSIGSSLYASTVWGAIPFTVEAKTIGSAFGICTAIQNVGLTIAPWLVSKIISLKVDPKDPQGDGINYLGSKIFYISMNALGLASAVLLNIIDKKKLKGAVN